MRGIGRLLVMDRPQPAVADAALSAHGPQPGAVFAAQGPVGIPGIAGRSFLHRHPRWLFSIAAPPAHRRKRKQRMCELLRADGADGTGGRTCTFISRFWRPLLCVKLRLQKSAGLSRLSAMKTGELKMKRGFTYVVGCPVPTSSSISMLPLDNVPTVTLFSCPKARKIFFCFRKTAVCRNTQAGIRKPFHLLRFSTERTSLKGLLLLPRPQ